MTRWGRDAEEIRLDIAYALGEGLDVVEHLEAQAQARAER